MARPKKEVKEEATDNSSTKPKKVEPEHENNDTSAVFTDDRGHPVS